MTTKQNASVGTLDKLTLSLFAILIVISGGTAAGEWRELVSH